MPVEKLFVEDGCLTNVRPETGEPDPGESWQTYIFVHHGAPDGPETIETVEGETKAKMNAALRKYVRRRHVKVLPPEPEEKT